MRPPSFGSDTRLKPSFLRMTPARKPRTECCCQPVAVMMAAIVVPARSCSIATTCAFLVPARVLGGAPDAVPMGTGRLDDLRLVIFGRARVIAFVLDLVLVMGASGDLRDAIRRTTSAPPRQVTRRGSTQKRASAASSHHSNARFAEECQSIPSNMIALFAREQYSGYCCLKRRTEA